MWNHVDIFGNCEERSKKAECKSLKSKVAFYLQEILGIYRASGLI